MEKGIVLFSLPLFLILVLQIAVFVLAYYPGTEPVMTASTEVNAPDTTVRIKGTESLSTWRS